LFIGILFISTGFGGSVKNGIYAVFVGALFLTGCAYYQPIGVSSTSIGSQYERPSGIAEGHATKWYFFPCYAWCQVGEDSLKAAMADAMVGRVGDTLANVYVERKTIAFPHIFFPLIAKSEIIVTGTLVKYNTKEFPLDNDKLTDFTLISKAEDVWPKLLAQADEIQQTCYNRLSNVAKGNLNVYLSNKEIKKEIKAGTRESELFAMVMGRELYQETKAATPDWGEYHQLPQAPAGK
jgi:hypothetical protein